MEKENKIHFIIRKKISGRRYICNQACAISKGKWTSEHSKVTCKNCLEILKQNRKNLKNGKRT